MLKKIFNTITAEYEEFSGLSMGLRIGAVLALSCLYFSLVIITHLTIAPYLIAGTKTYLVISVIYLFVFLVATLNILPILFPSLRGKASILMLLIFLFNFFPLVLVAFMIPQIAKYRTAILSFIIYLSISISGIVIFYDGVVEGIISSRPALSTMLLWGIAMLLVMMGIFIYGYVTEKMSVAKTRVDTEMAVARDIQAQLVPVTELSGKGYKIFGQTAAAKEIGGDFFDIVKLDDNKLLLAIGDVSGHNIGAGLIMAIVKGAFRTALKHTTNLEKLTAVMNEIVRENADKKTFVSFQCCLIDLEEKQLSLVNAGHLPLLHYHGAVKQIERFHTPGLALGLASGTTYQAQEIAVNSGDTLFFITDGIVEAMNKSREEFGLERTEAVLREITPDDSPRKIHEYLAAALRSFTGNSALQDDATFVAVRL